jgi:predicted PurR-regulated permease PerM
MMDPNETGSPPWQTGTRLVVGVLLLILLGWFIYSVRQLLPGIILALLLAYLLHPLVKRLAKLTRLPRWSVVVILYFFILVLLMGATTGIGFAVAQQLEGVFIGLGGLIDRIPEWLTSIQNQMIHIGPWVLDLSRINFEPIANQLSSAFQPLLLGTGSVLASFATTAASTVGMTLLVLIVSLYLLLDLDKVREAVLGLVPACYDQDVAQLMDKTGEVWQAFLRGQFILGIVIGSAVSVILSILRVRFALGLGLIAGLFEFVPIFGPFLSGAIAALVALFQGENWLGLAPLWYALLVVGMFIIIQQIENNILVPRIIGHSLNINPLLVLLSVLAGGILAGVIGVLLAAPIFATLRIWLGYIYRKVVILGSEPQPILVPPPRKRVPKIIRDMRKWFDPKTWIRKVKRKP